MPQGYADAIARNDVPFSTENHELAAEELREFWREDPTMSWREMGDRGEFSRTTYRRVYQEYFEAASEADAEPQAASDGGTVTIPSNPVEAFLAGYKRGRQE